MKDAIAENTIMKAATLKSDMTLAYLESPIGLVEIGASDLGVCHLVFKDAFQSTFQNSSRLGNGVPHTVQSEAVNNVVLRDCLEQLKPIFPASLKNLMCLWIYPAQSFNRRCGNV